MKKIVLTGTLVLLFVMGMGSIANATRTTADDPFIIAEHSDKQGNQSGHDDHRSSGNAHGNAYGNAGGNAGGNDNPVSVPEPATLLLLGTGLVGLALLERKRKNHT